MANKFFNCADKWVSRDFLLTCLFNSEELANTLNGIVKTTHTKAELREELRSELFLCLCELDEDNLKQIHDNGYLDYYIVRTLRNMYDSTTSQFYKRIKKSITERRGIEHGHLQIADDDTVAISDESVNEALKKLNWFEMQVLDLFVEHGSVAQISIATGVTVIYATKVLASARKKFKYALR
jgi:hypothetical protein